MASANQIKWELWYDDQSGVENSVEFINSPSDRIIRIGEQDSEVDISADQIDWLISCLERIRDEINLDIPKKC